MTRTPAARGALAVFGITLAAYLATMCRGVGLIDRGELMAAAWTFGIPHPTGYPTLTLLAGAVAHVVPLRPALTLNALAAVLAAAGAAVVARLLDRVLAAVAPALGAPARAACAAAAALAAAFTQVWWQQANGYEVYALHALFVALVTWLGVRWLDACALADAGAVPPASAARAGIAFAFVTGLSFTNHATTVLLAPGLVAAALLTPGGARALPRRVAALAPAFVAGLLPVLWLPLRAAMHPALDWGHPATPAALLHHLRGGDYARWLFADGHAMALQLRYLAWRVPLDWAYAGLVIAALGVPRLWRASRPLAAIAIGHTLAGLAFAVGYAIPDLDAMLLAAVPGIAMLFAAGLAAIHERAGARGALGVAAAIAVLGVVLHAGDCDERRNALAEGYTRDAIGPLPPRAVLLTDLWESLGAPALYLQQVEHWRTDVTLVSPVMARNGWYLDALARRAPDLAAGAGAAFAEYRGALAATAAGGATTRAALDAARLRCIDAMVAGAIDRRPVFTTGALELRAGWYAAPWRSVVRVVTDTAYVAEPEAAWAYRPWPGRADPYAALTVRAYALARIARAGYEARHGRLDRARRCMDEARGFDPHIRPERVAPQPLGWDRVVLETAALFRDLRTAPPPAER